MENVFYDSKLVVPINFSSDIMFSFLENAAAKIENAPQNKNKYKELPEAERKRLCVLIKPKANEVGESNKKIYDYLRVELAKKQIYFNVEIGSMYELILLTPFTRPTIENIRNIVKSAKNVDERLINLEKFNMAKEIAKEIKQERAKIKSKPKN